MAKVDLLLAELRDLKSNGPHFRIWHRFTHSPGLVVCAPGEEIATVALVYRGRLFLVPLSVSLRILFDYLATHSHFAQGASQIEAGIRADAFYVEHGRNGTLEDELIRKINRSAIKVYIQRIRKALAFVFSEAGCSIDPGKVVVSRETVGNEVLYRLKASFEWVHLD